MYTTKCLCYGFDAGFDQAACGKPLRESRHYRPPCDLTQETYCTSAGKSYPWQAVKRFVKENQGLMKRMYGDQRHIAVLQEELGSNEFADFYSHPHYRDVNEELNRNELYRNDEKDETSPRHLHNDPKVDDVLNTKFIYSEDPIVFKSKVNLPYFRPLTTQKIEIEIARENTTLTNTTVPTTNPSSDTTTETITTDGGSTVEYSTPTEKFTEIFTEGVQKKETVGEVLFQDMEEPPKKTNNQINFNLKGVNACPVKEEVVAPFWANNTRGEVLALLNLYPFEQYVHWEKCTFEHRQMYCRDGCRCEQQYRLHRLLAYDPHNECRGIFSDWFRFPSCCLCKCYNIPPDVRVTSRSPRTRNKEDDFNELPNFLGRFQEEFGEV
ncbi:protein spaetzle 4 isoform X2 [Photinus pyralis]|nr:protein spaetzle 4 isoform X2 [Photinus pyralis]